MNPGKLADTQTNFPLSGLKNSQIDAMHNILQNLLAVSFWDVACS